MCRANDAAALKLLFSASIKLIKLCAQKTKQRRSNVRGQTQLSFVCIKAGCLNGTGPRIVKHNEERERKKTTEVIRKLAMLSSMWTEAKLV